MLNLKEVKNIYFIGIGGIMMSAVAKYFLAQKKEISGSDRSKTEITDDLIKQGVKINFEQVKANINNEIDLVIYTKAISDNNEELAEAQKIGIPTYTVYQVLGELSIDKFTITIAGMHGKSTVSSMLGLLAVKAKLNPTVFVGTKLKEWNSNFKNGSSDYLISEACEYKNSFLEYKPDIAVINNIEAEHLDFFEDLDGIMQSFKQFTNQIKKEGWLIVNGDNERAKQIAENFVGNKVSFGLKNEVDFKAKNIKLGNKTKFKLICSQQWLEYNEQEFILQIPGEFNIYNALAVISVAAVLKIKVEIIKQVLQEFTGVWRRFEFKKEKNGIKYYDDYAHHPTEIRATLRAIKSRFKNKKYWLIYQPHLYSRTNDFLDEFVEVLGQVDNLILAPIYPAREINKWGIKSNDIVNLINKKYQQRKLPAVFIGKNYKIDTANDYIEIREYLAKNVKAGDIVMTMGAGDVDKILKY